MTNRFLFTESAIEQVTLPAKGRQYYYDTRISALELCVTHTGSKSFYIYRWIRETKRPQHIFIAKHPISMKWLREQATKVLGKIAEGIDPTAEKRAKKANITLEQLFSEYVERWCRGHKKSVKWDENIFKKKIKTSTLLKRPITDISRQDIYRLHSDIGKTQKVRANRTLALLSSMYSKALEWGYVKENPCRGIRRFKEISRERFLSKDEIPKFFKALNELSNETCRDYIYTLLFTGARRSNVLAMRWSELDFRDRVWRVAITKNGTSQVIPLSKTILERLEQRRDCDSTWVFPSKLSASGHLEEPKKPWQDLLDKAGLKDLRLHDLRRTFGSWQAITGASMAIIGKSLNHKSAQATQIYARLSIDPVREAVDKATDAILSHLKG